MGCDIHAAIEYKDEEGWKPLLIPNRWHGRGRNEPAESPRLDISRNYRLFSILANVRNGYGVAGVTTGVGFVPISEPRGVPKDVHARTLEEGLTGDHSESWVSLEELLTYDWTQRTKLCGVVNAEQFEHWERVKEWDPEPRRYCGGVSGSKIQYVSEDEMREYVKGVLDGARDWQARQEAMKQLDNNKYCQIWWELDYATAVGPELMSKILAPMLKLSRVYGPNVRLVMNFDS